MPAGHLDWQALDAGDWDETAAIFNRCYEHYVVPVRASGAELEARCRAESVVPALSYVVHDPDGPMAIALIARRATRRARLAALAIAPRARGKGLARAVVGRLLAESEARGDAAIELEVFEHNVPAVRLYAGQGFRRVDRLFGFHLASDAAETCHAVLRERPVAELSLQLARDCPQGLPPQDLPWQLQPETIRQMPAPWKVLAAGGSFALVDASGAGAVAVRLVYTVPEQRRRGHAGALVAALARLAGGRPLVTPQLIPQALAPAALALGAAPAEHAQLRMLRNRP